MQRDERAYLHDIIEACEGIEGALSGLDLAAYRASRLVRFAVGAECARLLAEIEGGGERVS